MSLNISKTPLPGVLIIEPAVFGDDRGFFLETFNQKKYADIGLDKPFVQDNHSHSAYGVLRGLHYQLCHPQAKLVFVVTGEIFDVAVDIRRGSPTFGRWTGVCLSQQNHKQIFVPEGFAHGFVVLSETADVIYKCTDFYTPGDGYGIIWSEASIGIDWPIETPILSAKDSQNPTLTNAPADHLPSYP